MANVHLGSLPVQVESARPTSLLTDHRRLAAGEIAGNCGEWLRSIRRKTVSCSDFVGGDPLISADEIVILQLCEGQFDRSGAVRSL